MSMTTAIVAVAIGLVPVPGNGRVDPITPAYAQMIGPIGQTVDAAGNVHLTGFARNSGQRFDLIVEPDGDVSGIVGSLDVSFNAKEVG